MILLRQQINNKEIGMLDYNAIFNEIADAQKKTKQQTYNKNLIKTDTTGNTIIGRLIPNLNDIKNSIWEYHHHGFKSKVKQDFSFFFLCPSTFGERCPICTQSIKMWKSGNPKDMEESKLIRRRTNTLVNFYIISDLKDPTNNGTVKILRYGQQIGTKIKLATEGDDKETYGQRVWRLDKEGCSFRIKTELVSKSKEESWVTYINSGFLRESAIDGMTEEKQKQILASVFDLTKQYERKPSTELEKEMHTHFLTDDVITIDTNGKTNSVEISVNNNTPLVPQTITKEETQKIETPKSDKKEITESEIDKMLADLQK